MNTPYLSFTLKSFVVQHSTLEEPVEIALLYGREGMTNRGVANVFNKLHHEHRLLECC